MIKVVQIRLIAESGLDCVNAIADLRHGLGTARVALSAPHQGRKGGWLAYGTLQVEDSSDLAATGPTTRLGRKSR
jgi:hypothetical protein